MSTLKNSDYFFWFTLGCDIVVENSLIIDPQSEIAHWTRNTLHSVCRLFVSQKPKYLEGLFVGNMTCIQYESI